MARLFRRGTGTLLQEELFQRIKPSDLADIRTIDEYDRWFLRIVESSCWEPFSKNGMEEDRWGYFAKLINIVVYEIVSNRELFEEADWRRLRQFLHLPIDSIVTDHLSQLDPNFPYVWRLKGMTKKEYVHVQESARRLADRHDVPPIWFEAAWSK